MKNSQRLLMSSSDSYNKSQALSFLHLKAKYLGNGQDKLNLSCVGVFIQLLMQLI